MFENLRKRFLGRVKQPEPSPTLVEDEHELDTVRIRTSKGREISFYFQPGNMEEMDAFLALPASEKRKGAAYWASLYGQLAPVATHEESIRKEHLASDRNDRRNEFISRAQFAKDWDVTEKEVEKMFDLAWDALMDKYEKREKKL